jgi:cell division protein FtsB
MCSAKTSSRLAWPLACALLGVLASCAPEQPENLSAEQRRELIVECNELKQQNNVLQRQVELLEAEKSVLEQTVEGLRDRERILSARLMRLQKDTTRQKEIIEVLNDLPAERDALRREAVQLKKRIVELEVRLRDLQEDPQPDESQESTAHPPVTSPAPQTP